MATQSIAGYTGKLWAGPSTGSIQEIAEIRNFECSIEQTELDATSHDSSGQREILLGVRSWSGSCEYLFAANTSSQTDLHVLISDGTLGTWEFYPNASSSSFPVYYGDGYVSGWTLGSPMDDPVVVGVEIMGSGALTQQTSS